MQKEIPYIQFNHPSNNHFGFEVLPIDRIALNKSDYEVDPEKPHQLKFYNLIFFTGGESEHFVDFIQHPIGTNSLVYLCKDQITAFHFKEGLKGFCIIFTEEFFVRNFDKLPNEVAYRLMNPHLFDPILQIPPDSYFVTYLNLILKEQDNTQASNPSQSSIIESLFIILLSKAGQLAPPPSFQSSDLAKNKLFRDFVSMLAEHFKRSRSADFYAKQLAVSYKHLNIVCKELVQKTAKTIIDDYVILQAKRNLINTNIKSTELAYEMGFEDPTNFTKYFKKCTGLTPNTFKKQHQ